MNTKPLASRRLIVQKYGGSSLATAEQIRSAAQQIAGLKQDGFNIVVVVSAMGKTTDELLRLAYSVSPRPHRRELDMILSTGERLSMALVSMALNDLQVPAISFTGSQAGVMTDETHSNAQIIDIRPIRLDAELARGRVVVLAGFQGVSPKTKEITTLGRGGSDTTAVAMAAHFQAERCEICKDVDGVHSADPNLVASTTRLKHLHYHSLLDMTFWGAKFLHYRSAELACCLAVQIHICLAHGKGSRTVIDANAQLFENAKILSVNSHADVRLWQIFEEDCATALSVMSEVLLAHELPLPQLLDSEKFDRSYRFLVTAPGELLDAMQAALLENKLFATDKEALATVTVTCQGSFASSQPADLAKALKSAGVGIGKIIFSAMSLTFVVEAQARVKAVRILHENG